MLKKSFNDAEWLGREPAVGEGVRFERIRRITGYLVGGLERFNDGKRAEERDRVKHMDFARHLPSPPGRISAIPSAWACSPACSGWRNSGSWQP